MIWELHEIARLSRRRGEKRSFFAPAGLFHHFPYENIDSQQEENYNPNQQDFSAANRHFHGFLSW